MNINLLEGNTALRVPFHEVTAEHDHARNPEEQDVEAGNQQGRGIKNIQIARLLRPSKARKRQQSGRKPGIEDIRVLLQLAAAALAAFIGSGARHGNLTAIQAMPCRNTMAPPELARNTPVMDVAHPLEVSLGIVLRNKDDLAFFHCLNSTFCQRLNLDEPLRRKTGLNNVFAALTLADGMYMIFGPDQQSLVLEIAQHALAHLIAVVAGIGAAILIEI